jgi:hypothetical protein
MKVTSVELENSLKLNYNHSTSQLISSKTPFDPSNHSHSRILDDLAALYQQERHNLEKHTNAFTKILKHHPSMVSTT